MKLRYFLGVFLGVFAVLSSAGQTTFESPVTYGSGGYPVAASVAVGDINGDGKPDLVVANQCVGLGQCASGGNVGVLLGNGDGTFVPTYAPGSGSYGANSVALSDLNGDGKLDLVVSNSCISSSDCGTSTVGVLLGNGDGTFLSAVTYISSGYEVSSVAVADVNGDGKPDILVSNRCVSSSNCATGSVSVFLGNGDGIFKDAVSYDSGGYYTSFVAVADVNRDGKPDLLLVNPCANSTSCNANTGSISVLLGNGDGTFQSAVNAPGGYYSPPTVAVSDVNGDGRLDLIVPNYSACSGPCANGVGVLLGNGDGTFQPEVDYDARGFEPRSVAVADVNGDGKPDLVVAEQCAAYPSCPSGIGTVGVLLGNGDGSFQTAQTYSSGGFELAFAVIATDLNGDNRTDLVVVDQFVSNGTYLGGVAVLINSTPAPTSTAVQCTPTPSTFGQTLTLSATISSGVRGTPTGTVIFSDGAATLGSSPLNASSVATLMMISTLSAGAHNITATYSGDTNFNSSSGSIVQTVNQASTTTTIVSSVNPSAFNQPVTFTATITPQFGGTATGNVIFESGGNNVLASVPLSGNVASFTTNALNGLGTLITAYYPGDSNLRSSYQSLDQMMNKAATKTIVMSSTNPALIKQPITFTAAVSGAYGGTPTGTVTFSEFGVGVLATETLSGATASFTTSFPIAGTYKIFATYKGDGDFQSSASLSVSQRVNKFPSSTAIVSGLNPSSYGQSVTFTATVTSTYGSPTGAVTFRRGTTALGTVPLSGNTATFTTSALNAGTNYINAVYGGDSNFATSTSPNVAQVVKKLATTTVLSLSPNPSALGQTVTFTATVSAALGTPTGTVTFKKGLTVLGTAALSGGVATFPISSLPSGSNSITARYGGSTNYQPSSSATLTEVVQ